MRLHRSLVGMLVWLAAALILARSSAARAQAVVQRTGFREDVVLDESLLRAGRGEVALTLSGGWAFASVETEGHSQSQSSVYVTPAIVGGYMVTGELELRVAIGLLYLRASAGSDSLTQDQFSGTGALQGLYHLPLGLGMAFYGGIGAGGYYGARDRPAPGTSSRTRYTNAGFLGQVMFGLLVQPGSSLFLRGGLRGDLLVGTESPEDPAAGASMFALDFLLNAEIVIGLRFG